VDGFERARLNEQKKRKSRDILMEDKHFGDIGTHTSHFGKARQRRIKEGRRAGRREVFICTSLAHDH